MPTKPPQRRLMPVTNLSRLRDRHVQIANEVQHGGKPSLDELVAYVNDVRALIMAYEAATDRIRHAERILDGEK